LRRVQIAHQHHINAAFHITGRQTEFFQPDKLAAGVADFFLQLTVAGIAQALAQINGAFRQGQGVIFDAAAVLTDQRHRFIVQQRHQHHRAGTTGHQSFISTFNTVAETQIKRLHPEQAALGYNMPLQNFRFFMHGYPAYNVGLAPEYNPMSLPDWQQIDTVLLDMDVTLLDLHFDNYFWLEHLPARYAEHHGLSEEEALSELNKSFVGLRGTLNWYCLDFWTDLTGLPVAELKRDVQH